MLTLGVILCGVVNHPIVLSIDVGTYLFKKILDLEVRYFYLRQRSGYVLCVYV